MNRIISISALVCAMFVSVHAADDTNEMPSLEIKRANIRMESSEDIAARDLNNVKAQLKNASPEKVKVLQNQIHSLKIAAARDSI